MFLREEKGGFSLLFSKGFLTSRGWALALELDYYNTVKKMTIY
jgi:hypothetical protein